MRALASQYFNYGRWRSQVMRRHPDTVNLRYLAPPTALVLVGGGLAAGIAGIWEPWLLVGLVLPAGYVCGVAVAAAITGRGLPLAARRWLPLVFATMHGAWGAGFLTSVRRYRRRGRP
jgi:hypothetical protein